MNKLNISKNIAELNWLKFSSPKSYDVALLSNNRHLRESLFMLNWLLSPPAYQWDYWHCMTSHGGIIPFSLDAVIQELEKLNSQ